MANIKKYRALEVLIYFAMLIIAFLLQTSNIIVKHNSPSASLVLALVLTVSFFENYWFSAIFGLFAGIMLDTVNVNGFGTYALIYMLTAFICSLVIEVFLQNNFASFSVVTIPVIMIVLFTEIIVRSGFVKGIFTLFFKYYILVTIYTFAIAFILYLLFHFVIKKDERFKKPKGIISVKK